MKAEVTALSFLKESSKLTLTLTSPEGNKDTLCFTLFLDDYRALGEPVVGTLLSPARLEALETAHKRREACRRALSLLEHGDNSQRLLYRKLRMRGFSEDASFFALSYVRERGWLNEEEQLRRLIVRLAEEKLWGEGRILPFCVGKGYRSDDVRALVTVLEEEGLLDFSRTKKRLFQKARPSTEKEWRACLYKHGFSTDGDNN